MAEKVLYWAWSAIAQPEYFLRKGRHHESNHQRRGQTCGRLHSHRLPYHQRHPLRLRRNEGPGLPRHCRAGLYTGRLCPELPHGKKKTIGFIVPDISNKFFGTIIESAENYLSTKGYHLIIANTKENVEREETNLRLLTADWWTGFWWPAPWTTSGILIL